MLINKKKYQFTHLTKYAYHDESIHKKIGDQYQVCPGIKNRKLVDGSHKCHHKNCVNPNHIVFESHGRNLARDSCKNKCLGHGSAPQCILDTEDQPVLPQIEGAYIRHGRIVNNCTEFKPQPHPGQLEITFKLVVPFNATNLEWPFK